LRHHWETYAAEHGPEALHEELRRVDPEAAARLHPHDVRRVVRALETAAGGGSVSRDRAPGPVYDALVFGLTMDRDYLYERIDARVDGMLAAGLEDEVRRLLEAGVRPDCLSMKSLGYRQMAAYLTGHCGYETAVEEIKKGTRHFAKRQLTWYRRMPYVHWLHLDRPPNYEQCVTTMAALLVEWMEKS
jgi:tRNA dimethylallyltransferase